MKPTLASLRLLVFTFFMSILIAGCAGLGNPPAAAPGNPPGNGGGNTTPQHNTFVFTRDLTTGNVLEFRTNSDGTLTAVSGSPLSLGARAIRTGGSRLFVATDTNLVAYNVDPASGGLTQVSSIALPPASFGIERHVAADTSHVYVDGKNSAGDRAVFGFIVGANGSLSAAPGTPPSVALSCDLCSSPVLMEMNSHFLLVSMSEAGHGPGAVDIFSIQADGSLKEASGLLGTGISIALHPNGQFEYDINADEFFEGNRIDSSGQVHNIFSRNDSSVSFGAVALNPAGTILLVSAAQSQTVLEVQSYTVNQSTGDITKMASPALFPRNFGSATFDPTGRFVFMNQDNHLLVFSFNSADGTFKQLQDIAAAEMGQLYFVVF